MISKSRTLLSQVSDPSGRFHRNLTRLTFLWCFSAYEVHENREKDEIDEVSVLKYTENQYAYINIHKAYGNSKRKYPNKISKFVFHISNFTVRGLLRHFKEWPTPRIRVTDFGIYVATSIYSTRGRKPWIMG